MNPLLRQSVLVLWVVTRRGCPLPKVQKPPGSPQHQLRSLLCRSGLDLTPLSRPVRSRARSHVLVEHLCLPVELRRPTRPPRFLPRYHYLLGAEISKRLAPSLSEWTTNFLDERSRTFSSTKRRRCKAGPSPSKYRLHHTNGCCVARAASTACTNRPPSRRPKSYFPRRTPSLTTVSRQA